jgi:predicted RNase H-like HicB family nuclease
VRSIFVRNLLVLGVVSPRSCVRTAIDCKERRISTMSRAATPASPVAVDVPVVLAAIVRAEPEGGYSASIPALPGCHTQGETLDEVRANLRDAAEGWLGVAHEDGVAREVAEGAS